MIVVNNTYQIAPWADILYAMDRNWWKQYFPLASVDFKGELYSIIHRFPGLKIAGIESFGNSGCGAIRLAESFGAKKIILIGYDCQKTNGKAHWHGNHVKGLGNAGGVLTWPKLFRKLSKALGADVDVVNCSRETALDCFRRADFDEVMNEYN